MPDQLAASTNPRAQLTTRSLDEEGFRISRKPRIIRQQRFKQHQSTGFQLNLASVLDAEEAPRQLVTKERRIWAGAIHMGKGVRDLHRRVAEFNKVQVA